MGLDRILAKSVQLFKLIGNQKYTAVDGDFLGNVYGEVLHGEAAHLKHVGQLGGLGQLINFAHIRFQDWNEGCREGLEWVLAGAERSESPTADPGPAQVWHEARVRHRGFA